MILHLIETGGPGGAEQMLLRLTDEYSRRGLAQMVCLRKEGWLAGEARKRGLPVAIKPLGRLPDLGWLRWMNKLARQKGVSGIHAHEFAMNVRGGILASWLRLPCVATVHGKGYFGDRRARRLAYLATSRLANMVAVSEDIRRQLVQSVGIDKGRVTVISNGVDIDRFAFDPKKRQVFRSRYGISEGTVLLGTIGSYYPVKGHRFLVEAMKPLASRFGNVHLLMAGQGALAADLQQQIDASGLASKIDIVGYVEDTAGFLSALDLFVLPSLSEGQPLSLLEAGANGRCIVASNVGGVPEILCNGKSALLVEAGDVDSLFSALLHLIENPDVCNRLSTNAERVVRQSWSIQSVADRYLNLLLSKEDIEKQCCKA